jgi:transcriptional regulator with XRE-family HTH domain/tetratricopeptide (TPR) repeat protein
MDETEPDDSFADMLRRKRGELGLTQDALAEQSGVSPQAISLLERGARRRPQRFTLDRLADALSLTPAERAAFDQLAATANAEPARTDPDWAVPRQLPLGTFSFIGRTADVDRLHDLVLRRGAVTTGVVLATIQGMAGVGKSALALEVAHAAADVYPDGSFFLNLRGFGAGVPLSPAESLGQLLRATGLPADAVPSSVERASALLRSRLASKRALLLLDNASGADQITPLLPGGSSCCVLVTSRANLTSLPADKRVRLHPLERPEALDVIRSIIGPSRTSAEPEAVDELVGLCGRLPLALSIAAARLAARPTWTARYLADRLSSESSRLDELTADHLGVRAALTVSVSQLADRQPAGQVSLADTFALLGTLTGADIGLEVAARLLDTTQLDAENALEQLVDVHLLESTVPGRYRFHDLVHVYARETADRHLTPASRQAALERVISLYRAVAWRSLELYEPLATRFAWRHDDWVEPTPWIRSAQDAFGWLDNERDTIAAILDSEHPTARDLLPGLMLGLATYMSVHGRIGDWRHVVTKTLELTDDPRLRAALLHDRAIAAADAGDAVQAADDLQQSVEAFRKLGDVPSEILVSGNYARVLSRVDRTPDAIAIMQRLEQLHRHSGDHGGQARALLNLSVLYETADDLPQCLSASTRSLELFELLGSDRGIALAVNNVGSALTMLGRPDLAIPHLRRSLELHESRADRGGITDVNRDLGEALVLAGDLDEGFRSLHQALTIAQERGDDRREASIHRSLGNAFLATGNKTDAHRELSIAFDYYEGRITKAAKEIKDLLGGLDG